MRRPEEISCFLVFGGTHFSWKRIKNGGFHCSSGLPRMGIKINVCGHVNEDEGRRKKGWESTIATCPIVHPGFIKCTPIKMVSMLQEIVIFFLFRFCDVVVGHIIFVWNWLLYLCAMPDPPEEEMDLLNASCPLHWLML